MYYFYSNCVDWPSGEVESLSEMIDSSTDITRDVFLEHVSLEQLIDLETQLTYEQDENEGLTMANDWHVSYHKSRLKGETVYYFTHSAIEYVFTR